MRVARSGDGGGTGRGGILRRRQRVAPSPPELRLAVEDAQGVPHHPDPTTSPAPLRRPAGPAMSVAAACEQYVASVRVRRPETRTAGNYAKVLLYLCDYLEARGKGGDVWAVSARDIEGWLEYLQTTPAQTTGRARSVYTIHNYATHVTACWHALADRGLVPAHVADALRVPAIPRSRRVKPVTFTDEAVAQLFAACGEGEMGTERDALTLRNHALVAVLLDSGVRVGELVSMRMEQIDWERRAVPVLKSKTETRVVSIGGEQTAARLRRYVQRARPWLAEVEREDGDNDVSAETGALWLNRDGYPLTSDGVGELLVRLRRRSEIRGPCSPHVCRRYYITRAIQRGVPIVEIARQCGVSPEVIMRHYYSATDDEALARIRQGSPLDALAREQRQQAGQVGPHGGRRVRRRRLDAAREEGE